MKSIYFCVSLVVGGLFLIYDLWLIGSGRFHPGAIVGLVAWLALLMFCTRYYRQPRE